MSNALSPFFAALRTALTNGTALASKVGTAIYKDLPPEGAALPYLVFNLQASTPDGITSSDMENYLIQIRVWASGDEQAHDIYNAANALLDKQALSVNGYTNFWSRREQDINFMDYLPSGELVYSAGGLFRFRLDQ